jgi:hypothetical protein
MPNLSVVILLACAICARAASYTTYIGDVYTYELAGVATDANGTTYVTGSRVITSASPAAPAFLFSSGLVTDVFVGKLDTSGNLISITTFSGKGSDQANGIAVDGLGNIYIAGVTTSADFPLRNPIQSTNGQGTGFLMKLAPDGSIVYSTFLGGTTGQSSMASVAADAQGNAYVTGWTGATDYQHTSGMPEGVVSYTADTTIYGAFFARSTRPAVRSSTPGRYRPGRLAVPSAKDFFHSPRETSSQ